MKKIFMIAVIIVAFSFGLFSSGYIFSVPAVETMLNETYEIPGNEFEIVTPIINGTTVSLIGDCYVLSFDITVDQAYSVAKALENSIGARPLTHDLIKDMLDNFNIRVIQTRIDRYNDEIYYATIFLRQNNQILEIDARPSDAIAIALRANLPIYINSDILELRGKYVCGE